jgi:cytochrome c-type biogenesis protein CcmH
MSPRDTQWFLAGAASGLVAGALGFYLLFGSNTVSSNTVTRNTAPETRNLLMPGDTWPTVADADSVSAAPADPSNQAEAGGALDEVTRNLAQRLAQQGGTDDEWRLLAQSYEFMGRTEDARAARTHIAATDGSRISGTVQISAEFATHTTPGTTLFIYATDGATPGPPLAVLRLKVDRWPVSFVLDDADAMIPGRNLSASKSVELEARISASGEALPRPGDLVGNVTNVNPHTTRAVNISIDHKIT